MPKSLFLFLTNIEDARPNCLGSTLANIWLPALGLSVLIKNMIAIAAMMMMMTTMTCCVEFHAGRECCSGWTRVMAISAIAQQEAKKELDV